MKLSLHFKKKKIAKESVKIIPQNLSLIVWFLDRTFHCLNHYLSQAMRKCIFRLEHLAKKDQHAQPQSDQSHCCLYEASIDPWLCMGQSVKANMRLRRCPAEKSLCRGIFHETHGKAYTCMYLREAVQTDALQLNFSLDLQRTTIKMTANIR